MATVCRIPSLQTFCDIHNVEEVEALKKKKMSKTNFKIEDLIVVENVNVNETATWRNSKWTCAMEGYASSSVRTTWQGGVLPGKNDGINNLTLPAVSAGINDVHTSGSFLSQTSPYLPPPGAIQPGLFSQPAAPCQAADPFPPGVDKK